MTLDPSSLFGRSSPTVGQFGNSAPEGERLLEAGHRLASVASGSGIASEPSGRLITRGIDPTLGESPTRPLRQNKAVAQGAPQGGDVGLQGLRGGTRGIITPEQLNQSFGRHDRTAGQAEHREDGARLPARNDDRRAVPPNLKRSQNPQLHGLKRTHVTDRR